MGCACLIHKICGYYYHGRNLLQNVEEQLVAKPI